MDNKDENNLRLVATTLFGLEEILMAELAAIGARDIEKHTRAVSFVGDKALIYKCNLLLRTALRILVPLTKYSVENDQDLYDKIKVIDWSKFLDAEDTLAIDTVLNTELFNHTQYISQKVKDAIVDQFREKLGKRPSVDLDYPTIRLNVHVFKNECSLSLDSSGDSLHKRGYRDKTNLAPINEVLAAGLVILSGWDKKQNFIDPMCGSGTILIEAAMIAANIPPGYYREDYNFMRWNKFLYFDDELYTSIFNEAIDSIDPNPPKLLGGELSHNVARKAKENIKRAKVSDFVHVRECNIKDFEAPEGGGVVIANPPYGNRMVKENIDELYKEVGDTFKHRFQGYDCWMISSNLEALKKVGLRPSRKITVYNGQLECRFMKYEMYSGTKKIHKLQKKD
jgi:putative N6-adenine-specific DNA methylase